MTIIAGEGASSLHPAREREEEQRRLLTVGHSRHDSARFLALLVGQGVHVVVDVRSQPYSRQARHFNKAELQRALAAQGLNYLFLGKELGGRPTDRSLYDLTGALDYAAVRRQRRYGGAIERVVALCMRARVALLCAEEDPARCHRHVLLAPDFEARKIPVWHLRGNGKLESDQQVRRRREPQLSLL